MIGKDVALQMAQEYAICELDVSNPNHSCRIEKISKIVFII